MTQSYDNNLFKNRIKSQTVANTAEQSFNIGNVFSNTYMIAEIHHIFIGILPVHYFFS